MNTNPTARRILCFGDSNVWGYKPATEYERYTTQERWTGLLQDMLGNDYEIIEDGVNSRTIVSADSRPGKESRMANDYINQCFFAHDPLDLVIIMLGTNELKTQFELSEEKIAQIIVNLLQKVSSLKLQHSKQSIPVLAIIPPPINSSIEYAESRYHEGLQRSQRLASILRQRLTEEEIAYVDTALTINDIGADGVHLTNEGHKKLAKAVYEKLRA